MEDLRLRIIDPHRIKTWGVDTLPAEHAQLVRVTRGGDEPVACYRVNVERIPMKVYEVIASDLAFRYGIDRDAVPYRLGEGWFLPCSEVEPDNFSPLPPAEQPTYSRLL